MGPWTRRSLPILLGLSLFVVPRAEASSLGVFFDAQGTTRSLAVSPMQSFQYFVLADGISSGLKGFEVQVLLDPRVVVLNRQLGVADALNVSNATDNWIVGFGSCFTQQPASLVTYTAWLLADAGSVSMSLEASSPSSVSGLAPAYLDCGSPTVHAFEVVSGAVLNPDEQSWGAVKQLYE